MAYDASKLTRLLHLKQALQAVVDNTPEYSIVKAANSGDYAAVYNLTKDGVIVGASINIPRDMVVSTGEVVTNPEGQAPGTYLHLVLANAENEDIYISATDLIEYVTSGSTAEDDVFITIDANHQVTAQFSAANKARMTKLDGIEEGANKYILPAATAETLGGIKVGADLAVAADGTLSGNYADATGAAHGLMSAADKAKLDLMVIASDEEVTEMLTEIFGA